MLKLFKERGSSKTLKSNQFISLQEDASVFFIEKGSVNLFGIALEGGEPTGPRTLLSTHLEKSVLFSINKDFTRPEMGTYGITEQETTIWKLPVSALEESLAQSNDLHEFFAYAINEWIISLASFSKKVEPKHEELFISSSEEYVCDPETTYCIKRPHTSAEKRIVIWVEVLTGASTICSYPSVTISQGDPWFPMTEQFCLKNEGEMKFLTHSTIELIEGHQWANCLTFFHERLFQYFFLFQEDRREKIKAKIKEKIEEEDETLNSVFKQMISLLNPEDVVSVAVSRDPLFQAMLLIGRTIKCEFILPRDLPIHCDASQQIEAICDASGVKHRQIRLAENWWKEDSGPLLAFYGEKKHPVVLVQRHGHYEILNPESKKRKVVTKKNADQFVRLGFTFYRPFPDKLKTAKEILIFYLQNNYKEFYPIIIYSSLASLIALFVPYATAQIFNRAIPDSNVSILVQLGAGLLITAVSYGVFVYLRTLGLVRLSGFASNQIQSAIWDRLLKLPVSFFRQYTTGNLVSKVTSFDQVRQMLSDNSARIILAGIFSLFYLLAMFVYSPILSIMSLILMILTLGITVAAFAYRIRFQTRVQKLSSIINGVLVQIISGVGKLRVAGAENNAFSYWAKLFIKMKKNELASQYINNVVTSMVGFLPIFSYLVIFGTVMILKAAGSISVGDFLGFNAAFTIFTTSIYSLSTAIMGLINIPPLWNNVRDIIEAPLEIVKEQAKIGKLTGDISIDEVSFWYERGGAQILNRICIQIEPKEFVALVGPSGCGKSTLVRLLLGFEKPDMGTIYYDGKDLASLNMHKLRKQIGVVLQGGGIISGTIYDNLVCGGVYSKKDVDECLELSGFAEDMASFPMGLHTFIPMGGETLSGGQKQRLLIARAILPKPKILVLDEATSALDNKVQDQVSKNIESLDITRIVIAHRLSTIKNADRIYVIDNGQVIQQGDFETLAEDEGLFKDMLERQRL